MYRSAIHIVLIGFFLSLVGCGVSQDEAKKDLKEYLKIHHENEYEILTFKRNFNTANMNPDLFWVEIGLVENPKVIISFEWDAKDKALYISAY
ncbi:hypothetical protein HPE56_06475 [Maribacter sp. ANRC-HE7]|uniref:Lipoprotein n=1 Tax=Maribacter aquimaris TaxID=2737171 RepID=A0ABR7UYS4_9FLAO|nr:hypothetical protein [Maribacter aquimaris]MBD0777431.1 hypothetical protein [Maribacter aquimaris]